MLRFFRAAAAALVCVCIAAVAAPAADLAANPTLLPKTLLALRGDQGDRTQLQLTFDRSRDGVAEAPLTVWIGADYFALVDGARLTITDRRLLRQFVVNRQEGTLVNLSLYGDLMFRRLELLRREQIETALTKAPSHPAVPEGLQRFWIESELGILGAGKIPPLVLRQVGKTTRFLRAGDQVAAVEPSDTAVPDRLGRSYSTFLHRTLPIHPSLARWLGQLGQVPALLDFTSEASGKSEHIALRLRNAQLVQADFPLPPRLSLLLVPWGTDDPDVALMREVLPHMTAAIVARAGTDRRAAIAQDRVAIDRDFSAGRKFAAALRLTDLALRWGRDATECDDGGPCRSSTEIDRLLRDDPRAVAMFKATALQQRQPAQALALWRGLDRHDVADGYVVDLFMAPLLSESGDRRAAAAAFATAFAGDPAIVLLYRELGDHFARVSRLDLAWLCYDLGRALPGRAPRDALSGIDTIEQELAATYPDML